jgi:galactonate dehydratase
MSIIAHIETFLVAPRWLFVRIETDDGLVGWGEASLEGHAEAVAGAIDGARDRLIGAPADRIEDAWQTLYRLGFYRGGPVLMSAISGIDQALWDIKGKRLGVPVWQLLGGQLRERIDVYAWIGGDRPDDVAEAAAARKAQGFRAVKMNGTEELGWLDSPSALDDVVKRLQLVRETGMDAGVDFHGRVHKPMARQLIKALEPLRPLFIEEPLLSDNPEAIAQLAQQTSVPIALGERLYTRMDMKRLFELGAVDIVQPDLSHAGGISEGRRIAAMAEAYDVAVAPHCRARWRWPPACNWRRRPPISSFRRCRWASITTRLPPICSPIASMPASSTSRMAASRCRARRGLASRSTRPMCGRRRKKDIAGAIRCGAAGTGACGNGDALCRQGGGRFRRAGRHRSGLLRRFRARGRPDFAARSQGG